jgi:hypothetical protein
MSAIKTVRAQVTLAALPAMLSLLREIAVDVRCRRE